ncbi:VacJ family lipoprotein [Salipiger bermudensis]|uniref:MlaA family lipoprotein n=1 Tax=Salipiger bermudensis TaxID=344736 RepID=UPI001C9912BD|nr:VacJ family lipoprotein [Salipiger bermudensis]MBY6002961.1 VacJ family lipoprotein [Salipiger bermudensis]
MPTPKTVLALCALLSLAACAVPGPGEAPDGIYDPQEGANRRIHAFNKRVDSALGGGGDGGASAIPAPILAGVANMADTLRTPRTVVNQVLQARLGRATRNTLRFGVNATVGIAGLFDVASGIGLPEDKSDFGETLHVWGFPEGAYIELPLIGPATEREAVGKLVDIALNPLGYVYLPSPERYYSVGIRAAGKVAERVEYGDTLDTLLYDSADSYAQTRNSYLSYRRYQLGDTETGAADYIDPEALDTEGF